VNHLKKERKTHSLYEYQHLSVIINQRDSLYSHHRYHWPAAILPLATRWQYFAITKNELQRASFQKQRVY